VSSSTYERTKESAEHFTILLPDLLEVLKDPFRCKRLPAESSTGRATTPPSTCIGVQLNVAAAITVTAVVAAAVAVVALVHVVLLIVLIVVAFVTAAAGIFITLVIGLAIVDTTNSWTIGTVGSGIPFRDDHLHPLAVLGLQRERNDNGRVLGYYTTVGTLAISAATSPTAPCEESTYDLIPILLDLGTPSCNRLGTVMSAFGEHRRDTILQESRVSAVRVIDRL
jgi:hypothetical protein